MVELKVMKEIDIKEIGYMPDYVMYRKRRYTYVPFSHCNGFEEAEKIAKKVNRGMEPYTGKAIMVRVYGRGGKGYPYGYAVFAKLDKS